ncbi:MAG: hypothetical protein ACRDRP_06540 [Pseudonocardiaceae bacterium]
MNTGPNTGRRWALSPVDSRSHLLAEADGAPVGMLVTDCGQLLPGPVDTSPHPPAGPRCSPCARAAGRAWAPFPEASSADVVAVLSPELVASLVLRRACDGGVAKAGNRYVDSGSPTPRYQAGTFDELINTGFLALAEQDLYGLRRVSVTEAGRVQYAQLVDIRTRAGQWVPKPRYPTTEPDSGGPSVEHPETGSGWRA